MDEEDSLFAQEFAASATAPYPPYLAAPSSDENSFDTTYVRPGMFLSEDTTERQENGNGDSRQKQRSGAGSGQAQRLKKTQKPCCGCSCHSTCHRVTTPKQSGFNCATKGQACMNCEYPPDKCRNHLQLTAASRTLSAFVVQKSIPSTTTATEPTVTRVGQPLP